MNRFSRDGCIIYLSVSKQPHWTLALSLIPPNHPLHHSLNPSKTLQQRDSLPTSA